MIKVIFFILLSFGCLNVYSKEIIIDDVSYNATGDIQGDGYFYAYNHDILYLDCYDGGSIKYDGNLTIMLKNQNIISGSEFDYGIKGNNIIIRDLGEILIKNVSIGIIADVLNLYETNVYIFSNDIGMHVSIGEINLYNSKLRIDTKGTGILGSDNMSVLNSKINILNSNIGISSISDLALNVFDSEIYIDSSYSLINCYSFDIDQSKLYMHGLVDGKTIIVNHESNQMYGSNNGKDFVKSNNYLGYFHLVINRISENERFNHESILIPFEEFIINKEVEKDDVEQEKTNNEEYSLEEISNPYTFDQINNYLYLFIISFTLITMVFIIKDCMNGKN